MSSRILLLLSCLQFSLCSTSQASIVDFTTWTLVADPVDPNFSGVASSTTATLLADSGLITAGTDIGFQSVDGLTPASSATGSAFDPSSDFTIAIDYAMTFSNNPMGFLGLGFGIGEDGSGMNSAGVAMATTDGSPFLTFAGAARINDQNQTPLILGLTPSTLAGSLFVEYDATTGDVIVGAATTPGAAMPAVSGTYSGIQNQWNDGALLASFFIRSDGPGWQSGNAEAVFSNFRVLEGTTTAVPEPSALAGIGVCGICLARFMFRRQRTRRRVTLNQGNLVR